MNQCQDRNSILEKKWVGQSSRFNKKLLPEYFQIDEKTLADFSVFASECGKQISFFSINDRPDGDWSSFLKDDPTVCLLFLQAFNTENPAKRAAELLEQLKKTNIEERKLSILKSLVVLSFSIFTEIERIISNLHPYQGFKTQLEKYITNRLSSYFLVVVETNEILRKKYEWDSSPVTNHRIAFGKYWRTDKTFSFPGLDIWTDEAGLMIGQNITKIIHDVEVLKKETHVFLNDEVLTKGNIKPHIALFIAFCDLYQHAQKKINHISERHLVHYYNSILGLTPMQGNSDSVYLTFLASSGANTVELNANTLFNYTFTPEGDPVCFSLNNPVAVHEGTINQVVGVNLSESPWKNTFMNRSAMNNSVFDLFGSSTENSFIGFEIASQYLILEEGDRRITFDFYLSRIESIKLKETINKKFFAYNLERVNDLIYGSWTCKYSNNEGMQAVEEKGLQVSLHTGTDEDRLIMRFDVLLKRYQPPLVSTDSEQPEGNAVMKFILTGKGLKLYTLFRDIRFSDPKLSIAVIGIKNLILQNEFGPLENERPFEPFGSKPITGSSLYIGHKNLFLKPLKELIINFEWYDLPIERGGFKEYYKDYEGIDDNAVFKVRLSNLKDKNRIPFENKQVFDLFTGISDGMHQAEVSTLSMIRRINEIDVQSIGLNSTSRIIGPLKEYDISTTDGFIRMELCYPDACFGHDQYPDLLKKEAFRSVKDKNAPAIINAPYTPTLKSVSLEYKANIDIKNWGQKFSFKKIHPFGSEGVSEADNWTILPHFPEGGSFFIGLDPILSTKEISFLFKISNQNSKSDADLVEAFTISVLDQGEWIALSPEKITSDSTKKLQQTGILKIQLPEMQAVEDILDGKNCWLRFDLIDPLTGYFIENIHLNAGIATRDHYLEPNSQPVAENTINRMKDSLVQLELIEQPYKSFGGRNPESEEKFRIRVSERIRHKSRAVSNKDIEGILLAHFPEIQSLKCLSHINSEYNFQPGSITIVVIPIENEGEELERYFPKEQLMIMQDFLNERALSGMRISVVNPVYEKVRLKFKVKFSKGYDEKLAMKNLNQKLMKFLDPWKSNKIITLGGVIPATTILNEIELEEYVDFATNFSLFHIVNGQIINLNTAQNNNEIIRPKYPVSVLIPDNNHKLLSFNDQIATDKPGINDMMIGNDFLIDINLVNADEGLGFDVLEKTFRLKSEPENKKSLNNIFTLYLNE